MRRLSVAMLGVVSMWAASGCCCPNLCGQGMGGFAPFGGCNTGSCAPGAGGYGYPAATPGAYYPPNYTSQATVTPIPITAAYPTPYGAPLATASLTPLESLPTY